MIVYIAWHPDFADGARLARDLYDHYRRDLYESVSGGAGLPVYYRSAPVPGARTPPAINLDEADTSAIILLVDEKLANDPEWVEWAHAVANQTDAAGLRARVFPVAIDAGATRIGFVTQAARWDRWSGLTFENRRRRLIADLTYQLCRILRSYLEHLNRPAEPEHALLQYLRKVEIFLSHSKHDDGERIAKLIRDFLHDGSDLESFFDVHNIPMGLRFDTVLLLKVKVSAVVAIHTDTYSSREWCRKEVIEAKRWHVPLVVANCINDLDERGFPYLGNVPVVRMDPMASDRIDVVVARLLDEILKDFLWRCWVKREGENAENDVVFIPRPPELITLAGLEDMADTEATLVYPEPPIGAEEQRLFEIVAPKVKLRSMMEWVAGVGV